MKMLFCIVGLIFSVTTFCQQQQIDTIIIKGYWVIQFKKSEIEFSSKNEKLRKEGKSYQRMVDFEQHDFFIPTEDIKSLNQQVMIRSSFNQKEFFYLPFRTEIEPFLEKNFTFSIDLSKQKNLFNADCNYYSNGQNDFLYKLYYIEGFSLVTLIENNELNKIELNISSDEVTKNLNSFKVYFIFDIKKVDCNQECISGFNIWKFKD